MSIQSSNVRLDLQEIDRQIEEALGDTTQGLSIGMISMEASADSEFDPEYSSGEESVWDIISLDFMDEEKGEELVTYDDFPALQPMSDSDESKCDSLPDLQSVSDSDESNASISSEGEQSNETPELETDESEDEVGVNNLEQEDDIILGPPEDFGGYVYGEEVPNGEVIMELLWKEELAHRKPNRVGSAHARKLEYFLELRQPYPEDPANCLQYKGRRFMAYDISEDEVCLMDIIRDFNTILPKSLAIDMWAWNAGRILELGAPHRQKKDQLLPRPKWQFHVSQVTEGQFEVFNRMLEFWVPVKEECLKNPLFNLIRWYGKQLQKKLDQLWSMFFEEETENLGIEQIENPADTDYVEGDLADLLRIVSAWNKLQVESMP
ncbi:hypothetical protein C0993_003300 [Termitomyces sp. T159_Od127]|nr:hypothetical protein C0993_003300 [Termitomyces sp. T159_Od127]